MLKIVFEYSNSGCVNTMNLFNIFRTLGIFEDFSAKHEFNVYLLYAKKLFKIRNTKSY